MNRRIRMGMVGGGKDAFIGGVHRIASRIDDQIELVCGAFSSSPEKSRESGKAFFLPGNRVYGSYEEMIMREKELPEGERMDFVSIVTPNFMHFPVAKMALENGFHVMSDKPVTFDLAEAQELRDLVKKTGLIFGLTHNYTGYPMVKQARHMARTGKLGTIRKVIAEYPQGWLGSALEDSGQKQADWRTDPKRAGISCCIGDIGTHAENLAEYVTGLKISELCADLTAFVQGRTLDDDGSVLVRFENGARGIIYASQVSTGEENGLRIRVYGTEAGIEWVQTEPNTLHIKYQDKNDEIIRTGVGDLCEAASYNTRIPAGHPEGFLEAFANLYRNFATVIDARLNGTEAPEVAQDFPTIEDGVRGMLFITKCVESSQSDQKWLKFTES